MVPVSYHLPRRSFNVAFHGARPLTSGYHAPPMRFLRTPLLLALPPACDPPPPSPQTPVAPSAPVASQTPAPTPAPPFPPGWQHHAARVQGEHGMVVTDAALATQVGIDILKAGGNAV